MFLRILAGTYLLAVAVLLAGAIIIANTYCESFGCIGIGIMWFAWAVCYGVVLLLGLALRRWTPTLPLLDKGSKAALVIQLLLGAGLACIWLTKRFVA
ncbi:MAG: hypothetical protein WC023_05050 [Rhodocyclaceae bacterium]